MTSDLNRYPLLGPRLSVVRRDPFEWENAAAVDLAAALFEDTSSWKL